MNIPYPLLIEAVVALDRRDGYVVLVADPETGYVDAHGPLDGLAATLLADQIRADLDAGGLVEVTIGISRLHRPAGRHHAHAGGQPGPTMCAGSSNS